MDGVMMVEMVFLDLQKDLEEVEEVVPVALEKSPHFLLHSLQVLGVDVEEKEFNFPLHLEILLQL